MFSTVLSLHGHLYIYFRNWLQILRPHVAREHYFFKGTDKHSLLKHLEHFIKSVPVVPAKFAGPIPAGTTGTKWTSRPVCPSRCTPSYDANSFSMVQVLTCLHFNIHSFHRRTSYNLGMYLHNRGRYSSKISIFPTTFFRCPISSRFFFMFFYLGFDLETRVPYSSSSLDMMALNFDWIYLWFFG